MNTTQLLEKIQIVVDAKGNQSAISLDLEDWEQLLMLLEEMEDANDILQAKQENEETISWEQAKAELGLNI
ncbi:MAG: hypothetical protein VKL41_09885 [Snowella sp.]|jgi:hypothetical protein|nr:hypothetical protein [Snowella sp.]